MKTLKEVQYTEEVKSDEHYVLYYSEETIEGERRMYVGSGDEITGRIKEILGINEIDQIPDAMGVFTDFAIFKWEF